MLKDEMTFDDEQVDVAVGCTIDLFVADAELPEGSCMICIKSTCFKSFVIIADLGQTTLQLKERIQE